MRGYGPGNTGPSFKAETIDSQLFPDVDSPPGAQLEAHKL
jgi:hypothetical protein